MIKNLFALSQAAIICSIEHQYTSYTAIYVCTIRIYPRYYALFIQDNDLSTFKLCSIYGVYIVVINQRWLMTTMYMRRAHRA